MRKATVIAMALVIAFGLAGCAADYESSSIDSCSKVAVLGKERTDTEPVLEVTTRNVRVTDGREGGKAFTVSGETVVRTSSESHIYEWTCFSQTVDGKTYADIQTFN